MGNLKTLLTNGMLIGILLSVSAQAAEVTVADADLSEGDNVTWTADNTYLLDGRVFVDSGATLTIEPGVVVRGKSGTGEEASVLVVARGAKIYAEGTKDKPIIFTAENDDITDPSDIEFTTAETWGGLIVLGAATINGGTDGENYIEGIPNEPRALYGGDNDDDNSGVIKYVSIRHAGIEIGEGNEINGLTMGGVGRGTTIEYVEVISNKDDGFEWFGGTVNGKHLIAAFCRDDAFDIDEGYRGNLQFLFAIQSSTTGDHCGEHDGAPKTNTNATPKTYPVIYNATYLGSGQDGTSDGTRVFRMREAFGGEYKNSIFGDYDGYGVTVEDEYDPDARDRMADGELLIENNIWFNLAAGSEWTDVAKEGETWTSDYLADSENGNTYEDPQLNGISRTAEGELDPRPAADGPAYNNVAAVPENGFFDPVDYKGAFGPNNWAIGWTALDHYGILDNASEEVTVTDTDISEGDFVVWNSNNTYLLDGRVFVDSGAVLTIEPGTVIRGKSGTGEEASVLVVARGAKIYAEGTKDKPIIFTAENDDITDPSDIEFTTAETWGGLIVLGAATINGGTDGENYIEGIPNEPRALYGGDNDDDNSGVIKYVSIRHAGIEIGEGNEINGLTMGGVGRGTTIEYVEVISNKDDGFEWFGGTVNGKHLIAAFCRDDAFDIDEGYRGNLQFLFAIQSSTTGDHCGEHDGAPKTNTNATPKTYPVIYNATYLGSGQDGTSDGTRVFRMREAFGGEYKNSIFGDYDGYGVTVEDEYDPDARDRMADGELLIENNIWFNLAAGSEWTDVAKEGETWTSDYLADSENGNTYEDPQLNSISREADGGLDPRPTSDGPAYDNLAAIPVDGFFEDVDYKGAFGSENWAAGWTALAHYGILGDESPITHRITSRTASKFHLAAITKGADISIQYNVPKSESITLSLYNVAGAKIMDLVNGNVHAGAYSVQLKKNLLSGGLYIARLKTQKGEQLSRAISIVK